MCEMRLPRDGDILVSHPTASLVRQIAIVPAPPHVTCGTYNQALEWARRLARERGVDAWLTEDLRNFLPLASFRPVPPPTIAARGQPGGAALSRSYSARRVTCS